MLVQNNKKAVKNDKKSLSISAGYWLSRSKHSNGYQESRCKLKPYSLTVDRTILKSCLFIFPELLTLLACLRKCLRSVTRSCNSFISFH